MRILSVLLICLMAVTFVGCSDNEQFRVNGTIAGKQSINLRVGYYADGSYQTLVTASREGKFEFFGSSRQPTLVEIFDNDWRPLARLYATNGETFDIELDRDKPYGIKISGNEVSERWSRFLNENADKMSAGGESANSAIASYIASNPADIVSTLLLVTLYNASQSPVMADSLMSMIEPAARPSTLTEAFNYNYQRLVTAEALGAPEILYIDARDSLRTFDASGAPLSMLVVSTETPYRNDSIAPAMRRLNKKYSRKELALLDYSADVDSVDWHIYIENDTVKWNTGWAPAALMAKGLDQLGIVDLPFVLLCDSTGTQLYRGRSVGEAEALIKNIR